MVKEIKKGSILIDNLEDIRKKVKRKKQLQ